jgi:hypothetical protein
VHQIAPRKPDRRVLRRALRDQYLRTLPNTVAERGVRAAAAQVGRRVRRALGRG